MAGLKRTRDKEDEYRRRAPRYFRPVDPKQAHIQQLNDEIAEDIIAASKRSPLVMLGIETVGIEQMTTLFSNQLTGSIFAPEGFTKSRLKELRHDPASPVDTTKPTVVVGAKEMVSRGLEGSRSTIGHEFIHAGIAALANFKRHNIGPNLEESVARHHVMVTGNPEQQATSRAIFKKKGWSHKMAEDVYNQLNELAAKRLNDQLNKKAADRLRLEKRRREQRIEANTFRLPDDGGRLSDTRVF